MRSALWILAGGISLAAIGCGSSDDTVDAAGGAAGASAGKGGSGGSSGSAGKGGGGSGGSAGTAGTAGKGGTGGSSGSSVGGAGGAGGSAGKGGAGGGGVGGGGVGGTGGVGTGGKGGSSGAGTGGVGGKGGTAGAGGAAGVGGKGGTAGGGAGGTGPKGGTGGSTGGAGTGGAGKGGAGGATPCTNGSACKTPANTDGLCIAQVCSDCADPADDSACTNAYGNGSASFLCLTGVCTAGNCRTTADCTTAGDECNAKHFCNKCDGVGTTFFVDPINGNDAATGSGLAGGSAAAGCAFRTVGAAIAHIGGGSAVALTISVAGPSSLSGETYPLTLPSNTTLKTAGGIVTVPFAGTVSAIQLNKALSGIDGAAGLVLDGTGTTGVNAHGITIGVGADTTTSIRNVTVKGTSGDGILVGAAGSAASIGHGVIVMNSAGSGLTVTGTATASLTVAAGEAPSVFENNTTAGISVSGTGVITIKGVPGATVDTGTVLATANVGPGLLITSTSATVSSVDGFVSYANTGAANGSGIRIAANSNVKVRKSVLLGNTLHGIHVPAGGNPTGVDLGIAGDFGMNQVQHTNGDGNINLGVGICFGTNGANTLMAQGNLFGTGKDCTITTPLLNRAMNCNPSGADIGRVTVATVDTTMCTN